ncbi:MAG: acetate/propionate family kinase [Chlorobiaceae bacterium]
MPLSKKIIALNTGSSSVKFALFEIGKTERLVFSGSLTGIGRSEGRFSVQDDRGNSITNERAATQHHNAACDYVFSWIQSQNEGNNPDALGHRIVHGSPLYSTPQIVTPELITSLDTMSSYAPEHLPQAINAIRHAARLFPGTLQVTCFDTSFHSTMPPVAKLYALPEAIRKKGVYRYGFHGLSYEYILLELKRRYGLEVVGKRIILAHLGHGASMAAVKDGKSIETTMGFSPAGGLVMSTRTGDLDPGVILFLLQENKMTPAGIKEMVNRQSGLLGLSGKTDDMRELLNIQKVDDAARQAVDLFCYQARKYIGALATVLGGLDIVVFTGGIGEHSPEIRSRICAGLEFLGIKVDDRKNSANSPVISEMSGPVEIRIMKTNEELMIARQTMKVLETWKKQTK